MISRPPSPPAPYALADAWGGACAAFAAGLEPPPRLDIDEWADRHRVLAAKSASEPGPWRTDRVPFLREIMRACSPSDPAREVVFMKSAQTGGTEVLLNALGHLIDTQRAPGMVVQPTIDLAERFSKQRVASMIDDAPTLRAKIAPSRSRDSGNTTLLKEWPGGVLVISGANSAASLRSMPVRFLLLDEVDAYPRDLDGEGDPVELAEARTRTFPRRKVVKVSTPTIESLSAINKAFKASDQRRYQVPCPHCGTFQVLRWANLTWPDGEPEKAAYRCEACELPIAEHHKTEMLARGRWVAENPGSRIAGFHISALYTPIGLGLNWLELAAKWEAVRSDPEKVKTFTNTLLGECFADPTEKLDADELKSREEAHAARTIPRGCLFLTGGVDVQKNRFACFTLGHGRGGQQWPIDYVEIPADPTREEDWQRVVDHFATIYTSAGGMPMRVAAVAVDCGYLTDAVLHFTRTQRGRFIAVKGVGGIRPIIGRPSQVDYTWRGKPMKGAGKLYTVGSDAAKHQLFARLTADRDRAPADRMVHFPRGLDASFYSQVTAEIWDPNKRRWIKTRRENEALDAWNYAVAASMQPALRVQTWQEPKWLTLEQAYEPRQSDLLGGLAPPPTPDMLGPEPEPEAPPPPASPAPVAPPVPRTPQPPAATKTAHAAFLSALQDARRARAMRP